MHKTCEEILKSMERQGRIVISDYQFPKPFPLERKLADVLEDEVDEKYYINNEKAHQLILDLIERGEIDGD